MLAFSNDYYGMIFRATQSVELFCAYGVIIVALMINSTNAKPKTAVVEGGNDDDDDF